MNGQMTLFEETNKGKEKPMETVFNDVLGFCCPRCLGVGIGKGCKKYKYCPECGQRLTFIKPKGC